MKNAGGTCFWSILEKSPLWSECVIKKGVSCVIFVEDEKSSALFVRNNIQNVKWKYLVHLYHFYIMSDESSIVAAGESVGKWVWPSSIVQVTLITVFLLLHIFSYFLYRICAYYLKWKREEKTIYQIFEELVKYMVLTLLYFLASNYSDMFSCSVDHSVLEYGIPYLSALFISGFLCEASYFRVRLVDIATWKMNTWLVYSFIVFLFVFLSIISFFYCKRKDLFFIPLLPVIAYFVIGYIVSRVVKHPRLVFHPRSYQLALLICLLRKENSFYCRLFAGICTGVFTRCVAANSIKSILEVIPESRDVENQPDPTYAATERDVETIETLDSPHTIEAIPNIENIENIENIPNIETIPNIEDIEDLEKLEKLEKMKELEMLQSSERLEHVDRSERLEHSEPKGSVRTNTETTSTLPSEPASAPGSKPRGGMFFNESHLNPAELAPLFPDPFSLSISENSDAVDRPLLESDALGNAMRVGNSLRDLSVRVNTSLSSLSPIEKETAESLQRSRASDVSDWNEQQIQDLFGSHERDL